MPRDPITQALMALERAREGDLIGAFDHLGRAETDVALDPDGMVSIATCLAVLTDRAEEALRLYDEGVRRNPTPPKWFKMVEARIAFFAGAYRRCVACTHAAPVHSSSMIFRCLACAALDDGEAAVAALKKLRSTFPKADFKRFADRFPVAHPHQRRSYDEAVRRLEVILATLE